MCSVEWREGVTIWATPKVAREPQTPCFHLNRMAEEVKFMSFLLPRIILQNACLKHDYKIKYVLISLITI